MEIKVFSGLGQETTKACHLENGKGISQISLETKLYLIA